MSDRLKRDYGMDIVRILAMFGVCVLHVGGWWKGVSAAPTYWDKTAAVSFYSLAYVAVNLFMMVSGYLGIHRNWKIKSFLRLWGEVAFYLLGGYLFGFLLNGTFPSFRCFAKAIFPIPLANAYWYFTAYAGAFFFFPYLNKGFLALSQKERGKLLLTLFGVICVFGFYNHQHIWGGFNAVWMMVMYLTGAYFKLHPLSLKTRHLLLIYIASSFLGGAVYMMETYLKHHHDCSLPIPGLSYTSPFTVCASIACFIVCSRLSPKSQFLRQMLEKISSLTFAVYLIHMHPMLTPYFWNFARWLATYSHNQWWHIPVVSFIMFAFCLFVESIRQRVFRGIASLYPHRTVSPLR